MLSHGKYLRGDIWSKWWYAAMAEATGTRWICAWMTSKN
jgi:hypothetical protein